MRLASIGRLLGFGLALGGALYAVHGAVGRFVIPRVSPEYRQLAEQLSAAALLLVMTLTTCVYVFSRWVPSLGSGLGPQEAETGRSDVFKREALAGWLLGLRWIAIIALIAVIFFATDLSRRVPTESAVVLWMLVVLLAAFNGTLSLIGPARLTARRIVALQIGVDVAVLGVAVHQVGGMTNPFASFFVFHAVIASLLFKPTWARAAVGVVAAAVVALTVLESASILPPGELRYLGGTAPPFDPLQVAAMGFAIVVLCVGCSFIVITLIDLLEHDRARLEEAHDNLKAEATQLTQAREELLTEQVKIQTIIDCMADAVIFATPSGQIALRNRAAGALWEHPGSGVMSESDDGPRPLEGLPTLNVSGRIWDANYSPVPNSAGESAGVVMVARDVTERTQKQRAQVEGERMATTGKLAAALAHELNNPLGAMVLFAEEAIKDIGPDEPLRAHIDTILRNAKLCRKIVRDLLQYARQRPPERRLIPAQELIDDVARTLKPRGERSAVTITTHVSDDYAGEIHGDPDQLRQVLVNFGLNAIDAMPDGGKLRFTVLNGENSGTQIRVTDTGSGIAPEERERIFSAFYTTKARGTGLGLAVAHDLVAAHGGGIALESVPDQGSTFSVLLPAAGPAAQQEARG